MPKRTHWTFFLAAPSLFYLHPSWADEQQSQLAQIERIVVSATRTEKRQLEVPAAITVQSFDVLRQKGLTYSTDEFRGVPGVFFLRGEDTPSISIRGATGNHGNDTFLALIDGMPFVGPDEEVLLSDVPYSIVEQVEIVRGPNSALYGRGAIGGAVNYQTRDPATDITELSLTAGSDNYYRGQLLLERQTEQGTGLFATLTHEKDKGWRDNSAQDTSSAFFKSRLALSDVSELTAWLSYFERDADVPSTIPTLANGDIVEVIGGSKSFLGQGPTRNNLQSWIGAVRYEHHLSHSLDLQVTLQTRQFDRDVRLNFYDYFEFDPANNMMGVNGFTSFNDTSVYFAEALLHWQNDRHNIVAGVSAERTTLDEKDRWSGALDPVFSGACGFRFYDILIDYSTGKIINDQADNTCFVREQLRTAADTTNQFYGLFIQDEIDLTDKLSLTLGARFDAFERDIDFTVIGTQPVDQSASGSANAISPKASLAYQQDNSLLYLSYGRGFNSNFGPVFQWDPNRYARDEAPTTIDNYELGWKGQALDRNLSWETALFYFEQKDRRIFIDNPNPAGPPTLATTGQKYTSHGLEASVSYRPTPATQLLFNYTYLAPKWDELIIAGSFGEPDSDYTNHTPQGVPEHIFYSEVSHQFSQWLQARLSYEWYGNYFVDLSNQVRTGQHQLVNLSATFTPLEDDKLTVDLSITNLLDEEYFYYFAASRTAATNATPGTPRQLRLGLRMTF
ncbi:TonB-dependent receptor [Bowmanella pacifica]|uniref:Ligand-gated channel protein n=1 Tax=Bowmanella pacifica TaxID=502051 RepID=A0A917Z313_9ALTE|nr:TonB-dependent receptor [Bowmanella pacifica]GGO72582.1 ligand-gated channel protein [Bowmanella pacifica]